MAFLPFWIASWPALRRPEPDILYILWYVVVEIQIGVVISWYRWVGNYVSCVGKMSGIFPSKITHICRAMRNTRGIPIPKNTVGLWNRHSALINSKWLEPSYLYLKLLVPTCWNSRKYVRLLDELILVSSKSSHTSHPCFFLYQYNSVVSRLWIWSFICHVLSPSPKSSSIVLSSPNLLFSTFRFRSITNVSIFLRV